MVIVSDANATAATGFSLTMRCSETRDGLDISYPRRLWQHSDVSLLCVRLSMFSVRSFVLFTIVTNSFWNFPLIVVSKGNFKEKNFQRQREIELKLGV